MRKFPKETNVSVDAVQNTIKQYGKHCTLDDLPERAENVEL